MGGALTIALSRAGFLLETIVFGSRKPAALLAEVNGDPVLVPSEGVTRIDSDAVLITVPDTEISSVADLAAGWLGGDSVLLHTSGALASEVLVPAREKGIPVGSMHPLISVSDPTAGSESFNGAYFCVEGMPAAVNCATVIARSLGGIPFTVETDQKPLYHAAAVLASGHLTALFQIAVMALARCGMDEAEAREALLPLAKSVLANLERQEPSAALTGPFARTDIDAIGWHLDAFDRARLPGVKRTYLELGLASLDLAEQSGGDPEKIAAIRDLIMLALAASR